MRVSEKTIQQYQWFLFAENIGKFYLDERCNPPVQRVLKKPVLLRARKRSYRGRDVKLISLKYRGREGFAVITGCSVNTRIKCAVQRWSTGGKRNRRDCPTLVSRNSRCYLSSPSLLPSRHSLLLSFFFFDPFRGSRHGGESHFRATEFLRADRGEPSMVRVFKSAVHK